MPYEESVLISRARAGDVASFETLVQEHQSRLFRLILVLCGNADDAEDALQETLLQAYRALPFFRGDAAISTWLHRIALNTTRNWLRRQARASADRIATRMVVSGSENTQPGPEQQFLARDHRRAVREAVLKLPPHYRDAIILRHYQEMPYEDIAEVLEVPIGTVRSRIAQARQLLLRRLQALDEPASTKDR